MSRDWRWEDPAPSDKPICSRFGSGAFPCGPVVKVRVGSSQHAPRAPRHATRTAMCQAHYVWFVTKTGISGGSSGFKTRAKSLAFERLAAQHPEAFQALYEQAIRDLCATTEPPIDPTILLPTGGAA